MKRIPIIDSHTGGEPTRVVLGSVTADELETSQWYVWSRTVAIDRTAGLRALLTLVWVGDRGSGLRAGLRGLVRGVRVTRTG